MNNMLRWTEGQLDGYRHKRGQVRCAGCDAVVQRNGPTQRYCESCSETRDLERKRLWARAHPRSDHACAETGRILREATTAAGAQLSRHEAVGIAEAYGQPDLVWLVRFSVPFSYAVSKNHIYTKRAKGHVALRRESRILRDTIAEEARAAVQGRAIHKHKVWLDIFVQKPNHRGDAVNVVDLVCDGVKAGLGLDDRWFSVRGIDWQVAKTDPRLFIGIGQEAVVDSQVCSSCGRILPLAAFNKNVGNLHGVTRNCKECRSVGRLLSRKHRREVELEGGPANS